MKDMEEFIPLICGLKGTNITKQEEIFLNTLRSLEKSEAEFLLAIKEKTMPFKSVTKEIAELAGFDLSPK